MHRLPLQTLLPLVLVILSLVLFLLQTLFLLVRRDGLASSGLLTLTDVVPEPPSPLGPPPLATELRDRVSKWLGDIATAEPVEICT